MRADRLISILLQLQVHERMTAAELAERLEVSERTIHRDMDALSGAGFPVYAERGVGGGWSLLEGYKTNFTALNETEIQTIFLSKPQGVLADLGLNDAADRALNKLLASLPAIYRRDAEYYQQRIHIDTSRGRDSDEDVFFLPHLQEAIWQEKQIQLTYKLSRGPVIEPVLHPLGLVAKGSIWYLVALHEGEMGVYRVSNIQEAQILSVNCTRPVGFDLATFWAKSSAEFAARRPPYQVVAQVSQALVNQLIQGCTYPFIEPLESSNNEGLYKVAFCFDTEDEAFNYMIKNGTQIEVTAPVELRERLLIHASEMIMYYQRESRVNRQELANQRRYARKKRLAA